MKDSLISDNSKRDTLYNPELLQVAEFLERRNEILQNNGLLAKKEKSPQNIILTFYYDSEGSIIFQKETDLTYQLHRNGIPRKIVFDLIKKKAYVPTDELADLCKLDTQTVRRKIQKINSAFAKKFKINQKLIDGKINNGYRINPFLQLLSKRNNP